MTLYHIIMPFTSNIISEMKKIFQSYDFNNDGRLNIQEFNKFTAAFGEKLTKIELNEAINTLDSNHDNNISFEEFLELFKE